MDVSVNGLSYKLVVFQTDGGFVHEGGKVDLFLIGEKLEKRIELI